MKSGEWREVWGDVWGHCGMGVVRQCACGRGVPRPYGWVYVRLKTGMVLAAMMCRGPDSPQGCPAIRPLRIRGSSWPSRNRAARQCSCGRGVPRPYERGTVCGYRGMGGSGARLVGRKKREAPGWGLSVIGSWGRGARVPGRFVCGALPGQKKHCVNVIFLRAGHSLPQRTGPQRAGGGAYFLLGTSRALPPI